MPLLRDFQDLLRRNSLLDDAVRFAPESGIGGYQALKNSQSGSQVLFGIHQITGFRVFADVQQSQVGLILLRQRHCIRRGREGFRREVRGKQDVSHLRGALRIGQCVRAHGHDRAHRSAENIFGHRAHQHLFESRPAPRADHNQIDVVFLDDRGQH